MQKIKIGKAKVSDSQTIRKLEEKVWDEEVTNKYDIPMFVRFGYVYVAHDGKKLIGAIVGYRTNRDEIYICDLVVDKKYRGLKIGERLYRKLLKDTKGKNTVSFINLGNAESIGLHKKLGAKIVGKIKNAYNLGEGNRLFVRLKN